MFPADSLASVLALGDLSATDSSGGYRWIWPIGNPQFGRNSPRKMEEFFAKISAIGNGPKGHLVTSGVTTGRQGRRTVRLVEPRRGSDGRKYRGWGPTGSARNSLGGLHQESLSTRSLLSSLTALTHFLLLRVDIVTISHLIVWVCDYFLVKIRGTRQKVER